MFLMSLWRNIAHRNRVEADLDDEMRAVYEMLVDEKVRRGLSRAEARRAAALELGGAEQVKERVRDVRAGAFVESILRDFRHAARTFRRTPGFTVVAVLTLAVGIGANTAIFSLIDAVIFKPLPVDQPGELFVVSARRPGDTPADLIAGARAMRFSYPAFRRYAGSVTPPASLAAMSRVGSYYVGGGSEVQPRGENVQLVSGAFFSTFGLTAERGRLLTLADERDTAPVAILSDFLWRRRFNASDEVIGQTITVSGASITVVGVLNAPFTGAWTDTRVGVWMPLSLQHTIRYLQNYSASNSDPDASFLPQEGITWLTLVGRAPGGILEPARAQLEATHSRQLQDAADRATVTDPRARARFLSERLSLDPFASGFSALRDRFSKALALMMGLVGALLLIACANIANLLLARAATRQRELGIRRSLGATRRRIVQQILIENFGLTLAAGAIGVGLAYPASRVLATMILNGNATTAAFAFDGRVLAFSLAATIVTAALAGIIPALRASSADITSVIGGATRNAMPTHRGAMRTLVIVQVALSLVLVLVAAISARSLLSVLRVEPGFNRDKLLQVNLDFHGRATPTSAFPAERARVAARIGTLPGIATTAYSICALADNCRSVSDVRIEGYQPAADEHVLLLENRISPAYFDTVGMRLLAGRAFSERDANPPSPATRAAPIAVINETAARAYFRGRDPIGRHIGYGTLDIAIVGVVSDARVLNVRDAPMPMAFYPLPDQSPRVILSVRTVESPSSLVASLPRAIASVEPDVDVGLVRTVDEQISRGIQQDRLIAYLTSAFGIVALLLAAIGLYGVISFGVARRTNEIGIRMAIGARPVQAFTLVLGEGGRVIAIGVGLGLAAGALVVKVASAFLFDASVNAAAYALVVLVLTSVALLACYFPARRAARLNPMTAIRIE